jgi:hypothetical protein
MMPAQPLAYRLSMMCLTFVWTGRSPNCIVTSARNGALWLDRNAKANSPTLLEPRMYVVAEILGQSVAWHWASITIRVAA